MSQILSFSTFNKQSNLLRQSKMKMGTIPKIRLVSQFQFILLKICCWNTNFSNCCLILLMFIFVSCISQNYRLYIRIIVDICLLFLWFLFFPWPNRLDNHFRLGGLIDHEKLIGWDEIIPYTAFIQFVHEFAFITILQ